MAIQINDGFQANAPRLLDMRSGKLVAGKSVPYASVAEALAAIPNAYRYEGLEFLVNDGTLKKYRFTVAFATDGVEQVVLNELLNNYQPLKGELSPSDSILQAFGKLQQQLTVKENILGSDWKSRQATGDNGWFSVTYGNGLFVAVAFSGTNPVMTSPDGINWTQQSVSGGYTSVTFGKNLFVAVGYNSIITSPNGINWTARTSPSNRNWNSVTYGNGLFVAVSQTPTTPSVMTSPDGINWTARTALTGQWRSVTYGNGLFVAVANNGTNRVMTSPDGINWTLRTPAQVNVWNSVTYGNGLFVAVASNGTNRVMTSPDGINWTARTAAVNSQWTSVVYGGGLFVAVADDYVSTPSVMTSPDGINWTAREEAEKNYWFSVTYGNGLFVAVANNGTNRVMTSGELNNPRLERTEFIDYSNISTISGWSSFNTKNVRCKLLDKQLKVTFDISGESNDITAMFTLPFYISANAVNKLNVFIGVDDNNPCFCTASVYGSTVSFSKFSAQNGIEYFTDFGTKTIYGQFDIELD